ncbi:MAG: hypothetical protein RLZ04_316 [Actinomycetota bacterium]|jgi:AcrR family transcriptional regulator
MAVPADRRSTRDRILEAAVDLLRTHGMAGFRIDQVLNASDASASSLYHHFGDRNGLIRETSRLIHRELVMSEDAQHLDRGFAAETHQEFCDYIEGELRRAATCAVNRERRARRIQLMSQAIGDRPTHARETEFQVLMTSTIADVFEFAKLKGIINHELDSFAYCAWFQGALLGQLLTDAVQSDVERWLAIAVPAALAPLRLHASQAVQGERGASVITTPVEANSTRFG